MGSWEPKNAEATVRKCSSETVAQRSSVKKMFLKISQRHLCQSLFIINKVAGEGQQLYLKRDPGTGVSCEFCEILGTPFLTEHLWWLLLVLQNRCSYKFPDIYQKISVLKSLFNIV